MDRSAIGQKIQSLINLHNVSLSKVASATGLTAETIRQIVNGTIKNPGIETLSRIAEAFSISLPELLGTDGAISVINTKRIKIVDLFEIQKIRHGKNIETLVEQSIVSTEMIYIESCPESLFFAVEVNNNLAEKLSTCGLPLMKQGDLLIFIRTGACSINSIVITGYDQAPPVLGLVMEIEPAHIWVKSVEIPQKQTILKIKKKSLIGVLHNVQFK